MKPSLTVVVACADSKGLDAPPERSFRSYSADSVEAAARDWITSLSGAAGNGLPAHLLYRGVYWSNVTSLYQDLHDRGDPTGIWICSAGYGLIPMNAVVAGYQAAFTEGKPDTIPASVSSAWWAALGRWSGPVPGEPRTLVQLALARPRTAIIVVAGPGYVRAMADDLLATRAALEIREDLVIVSVGSRGASWLPAGLRPAVLDCDSRWEHSLGRGKVALSIRLARELILRADFSRAGLRGAVASMQREALALPPAIRYDRAPQTDAEVLAYLEKLLCQNPGVSFTGALREFRTAGLACEYRRFRAIYLKVKTAYVQA